MAASKQVLSLLVAALLLHMATMLKISAFNIKAFGDSKMSNQTIADIIVSILSGYDITLVQEVRDADLSAVKKLIDQLNSMSPHPYSFLDSIPLGRTSYKEQYVFIYRLDMVSVLESYYYNDSCGSCGTDAFSRDPFIDIFLLGDFNADCSYVTSTQWPSIRLRSLDACEWLIPDNADTTVSDTDCAYDRIVACGTALRQDIEPGSATVNDFQKTFHLQSKDALAVSDHFPVEVTLKSR
ncbi:deoxyribonuclease-1-like isoform X3 [Lathamus discolor]|uniref:deoxyribonuclease-1-like isoform X3 n=1 Tax=Lathamus discolor TaxID=678569 RepID=UPI0032B7315C